MEAGAGEPAVVLEAGPGNGAASWQRVMPLLAPHVRVAAYDRAGKGGSAPAPGLVTTGRQIDDLASVITGLAAGPCVLVGHSWGAILVQLLALRRPDLPLPSSGGGVSYAPSSPDELEVLPEARPEFANHRFHLGTAAEVRSGLAHETTAVAIEDEASSCISRPETRGRFWRWPPTRCVSRGRRSAAGCRGDLGRSALRSG